LLFSGDLNAACPNSVIEAMACGLPVLAFDTGALKELVATDAGRIVPYGGDAWKLDSPNISNLAEGAKEILGNQANFNSGARARAEAQFGLDQMVDAYIGAMSG
jgi:glycosyltransferase involved in cell wall biosynthesis